MKEALLHLIRASEIARKMDATMNSLGYSNNPYADIFGELADGIYYLLGEKKEYFEDSATHWALNGDVLPEQDKVDILLEVYRKNRPARL